MRPIPLTTVELQKLASLKLNLSAETTMQVAEKLYNGGHLSYPRTETDQFQANFDLRGICELQRADPEWGAYATSLLDEAGKFVWPRAGRNNDQSHPPIHPTKPGGELTGVERSLYELVARHLLACCSDDARGRQTTLVVRVGDDERFQAEGVMIDARNFLDVYKYVTWSARTLPVFANGERVQPEALEMLSGQTTAPLPLNEHDLISKMDEHGIGTDATIAQHIATIQRREYVTKNAQSRFIPTTLGVALIDGYKRFGYELEKPRMRAEMEQDMQAITRGAKSRDDVVRAWVARYRDIFRTVVQQGEAFDAAFGVHFQRAPEQVEQQTPAFSACCVRRTVHAARQLGGRPPRDRTGVLGLRAQVGAGRSASEHAGGDAAPLRALQRAGAQRDQQLHRHHDAHLSAVLRQSAGAAARRRRGQWSAPVDAVLHVHAPDVHVGARPPPHRRATLPDNVSQPAAPASVSCT
jgi:DNA topoisomerase-3